MTALLTIPAAQPFLPALADWLRTLPATERAASIVLLPTRRACRSLRALLADGEPVLVPRLLPLGEVDTDALLLDEGSFADGPLSPAISVLQRQLWLCHLIQSRARSQQARGLPGLRPAAAAALAASLAQLLDELQIHAVAAERLAGLLADQLPEHWQQNLPYVQLIARAWPDVLAAAGLLDPVVHHQQALRGQIAHWQEKPPPWLVVAGSTGSRPIIRELMQAALGLPGGMVVLPGLDTQLEEAAWQDLPPTHPQFMLRDLLTGLGVSRAAVRRFADGAALPPPGRRSRFLTEVMRPAAHTGAWQDLSRDPDWQVPDNLHCLVASDPDHEATTIALLLRETLAQAGATAALVTPDRAIARRVAAALVAYDIRLDDSAGQPLLAQPTLVFLRLLLAAAGAEAGLVDYLALLKHPLCALGMAPVQCRDRARLLERSWRLAAMPPLPPLALSATTPDLQPLLGPLRAALGPLQDVLQTSHPPAIVLDALLLAAEQAAATDTDSGAARLWLGEGPEQAQTIIAELRLAIQDAPPMGGSEFPSFFEVLLQPHRVQRPLGQHPRLFLLGPLEARLLSFDRLILAGLNEGVWPSLPAADPWLAPLHRRQLGLPLLETRLGQAAHDFVQFCASNRTVYLIRAQRDDAGPTIPSRWWVRLETLSQTATQRPVGPPHPQWAAIMPPPGPQATPPAPVPQAGRFLEQLNVTDAAYLATDRYRLYARHILHLQPLPLLLAAAGAREWGILVHRILERAAAARLLADWPGLWHVAQAELMALPLSRVQQAQWLARLEPCLRSCWQQQQDWQEQGWQPISWEDKAELRLMVRDDLTVRLRGKVDRIDCRAASLAIIDYKSGTVPTLKSVQDWQQPQLPLLALLLERAEQPFAAARGATALRGQADTLLYWPIGRHKKPLSVGESDPALPQQLRAEAEPWLRGQLLALAAPTTPWLAAASAHDDYAYLKRSAAWGVTAAADDDSLAEDPITGAPA